MKHMAISALGRSGLLAVAAAVAVALPPISADDRFADLDRIAEAELAGAKIPGALVAVVEKDKIVYAKAFGVANVESGQPMTPDMIFPIASLTKMFTAIAAASLAEDGTLDLQAPIGRYVPGLPPGLASVTAHQLLSHDAGLRDNSPTAGPIYDDNVIGEQARGYDDGIFFTEPGKVFSYSNQGFNLVGYVLERVAGAPYSELIGRRLLGPLGMTHSTYRLSEAVKSPLSQLHLISPGRPVAVARPYPIAQWPACGMFSTLGDLGRFAIAFMNDGWIDGRQAMSASAIKRVATPYVPVHSELADGQYGYGLVTLDYRGVRVVQHGGILVGAASRLVMAPARRIAVITFANAPIQLGRTLQKALEIMLPLKALPPGARPLPLSPSEADEYVGRYSQGTVQEVVRSENSIGLRTSGSTVVPMTRIGPDRFVLGAAGVDPAEVAFVRAADGHVAYLHMRLRAYRRIQ